MKLIIATLLALTALAAADISCDLCKNHYQYCLDNGVVPGIDKEAQICAEHVCFQNPEVSGYVSRIWSPRADM
ncbi:hypothetical protein SNOG_05990 [Parastagonospora nodorum SN15]|uniref:Extracellular membrane protein CFEM domain-containing protein n=1 Tax=Phaeosphaeria nodorum (strain SN15 / ATCC MYA-4574 / FGSC 10173) TaxID=321614 RepID=Q0UQH4_PHANO|nr:hypothetical protein SNOG_05990 [Parastagonospora nodorum SN15]EAT87054.2 hypothetical protein SNOG_05990 [Parastagonospora nodorum SN15]